MTIFYFLQTCIILFFNILQNNKIITLLLHGRDFNVSSQLLNEMAQKNTRSIEEAKKTTVSEKTNNNVQSYKQNAKPGSLASKANMVSDFNNRNR